MNQKPNQQNTIIEEEKAILKEEKEILREERGILREVKKEERMIRKLTRNVWILSGLIILIIGGSAAGLTYWKMAQGRVYTDRAQISAPSIDLAPQGSGILQEVFVHEGDQISANTTVARVGDELIKAKVDGLVITAHDDIGTLFNRGQSVVTMVNPNELRVVGSIDEDKGLRDIRIGQRAVFTVDAFGSKKYEGVVDQISPSSRQGDIVFNISDKRPVQQFDVKVRFNVDQYSELKNGMSAKLWIYK